MTSTPPSFIYHWRCRSRSRFTLLRMCDISCTRRNWHSKSKSLDVGPAVDIKCPGGVVMVCATLSLILLSYVHTSFALLHSISFLAP
ncbi:hypothetical protein M3J09_008041 [Ascochyta lentis]